MQVNQIFHRNFAFVGENGKFTVVSRTNQKEKRIYKENTYAQRRCYH
jgi:hypothetical protein